MKNPKYYFVYGTLKEGYSNHSILNTSKKVAEVTTDPKFTMISLGAFPGLLNGGDTAIKGELYEVTSEEVERRLDALEGYRPGNSTGNLYNKETIRLDGKDAYIYIFNRSFTNQSELSNKITTGEW